jgi:hypothetical protein
VPVTEFADLIFTIARSLMAPSHFVDVSVVDGFFPRAGRNDGGHFLAALPASGHGPEPVIVLLVA